MSWECSCGNKSEANIKGIIGHTLLRGCIECTKFTLPMPSPHELHDKYHGSKTDYINAMHSFKYLKSKSEEINGKVRQ